VLHNFEPAATGDEVHAAALQYVRKVSGATKPSKANQEAFDRAVHETITVGGATFHLVDGRGFRYEVYRDRVLDEIRRRYYAVPRWLPGDACYFCDRYFPDRSCRAP